jgi:hypothetical protein
MNPLVLQSKERKVDSKRSHGLTQIALGSTKLIQKRNRAWNLVGANEPGEAQHCQSAIVGFSDESTFFDISCHILVQTKRIVKVQDGMDLITKGLKRRELSWLPSFGVVRKHLAATEFVPDFQKTDNVRKSGFWTAELLGQFLLPEYKRNTNDTVLKSPFNALKQRIGANFY